MDAVQLDSPLSQPTAWEQAQSLRLAGHPAEAVRIIRKRLDDEANEYRLHDELGMALIALNRPEEAIGSFMTAFRLKPDFDEACNKIGSAFASRGMLEPAAEWFARARQVNPASTMYSYSYGCILVQLNSHEQAAKVFDLWVKAEPENPIARHLAGAVLESTSIAQASPDYVCALFDDCAVRFDENLTKLKYCGPELVVHALARVSSPPSAGWDVLDAGCGTGLVGVALKPFARRLVGVDLSTGMLEVAGRRSIYDELIPLDIVEFFRAHPNEFDVITAADLLTYIGDIGDFFTHAARALRPGGLVVVAAEALKTTQRFRLNPTGRFSHSQCYLRHAMETAGIAVAYVKEDVMRYESSRPVPTWVAVGVTRKE